MSQLTVGATKQPDAENNFAFPAGRQPRTKLFSVQS